MLVIFSMSLFLSAVSLWMFALSNALRDSPCWVICSSVRFLCIFMSLFTSSNFESFVDFSSSSYWSNSCLKFLIIVSTQSNRFFSLSALISLLCISRPFSPWPFLRINFRIANSVSAFFLSTRAVNSFIDAQSCPSSHFLVSLLTSSYILSFLVFSPLIFAIDSYMSASHSFSLVLYSAAKTA